MSHPPRALALTLGLLAAAVIAALPAPTHAADDALAGLAKLSEDVQIAVVIPNLMRTNRALADVGRRYDVPVPQIDDLLSAFKREAGMYGVDDDGAMIIAFSQLERAIRGEGRPDVFVLVPIRSYATFVETYDGAPDADVTTLALPRHTGYARDLGSHALLGATEQGVADYQPLDDSRAITDRLGPYGRRYLAQASAALYIDTAALRPVTEQAIAALAELPAEALAPDAPDANDAHAAATGELTVDHDAVAEFAQGVMAFLEGVDAALLTLEADDQGIALTQALAYRDGSPLASYLPGGTRDLGEEIARLPDQPFLLAGAVHMPAVNLGSWLDRLEADGAMPADALDRLRTLIDRSGTVSTAYYTPTRQLLMAGNLINQVTIVETDDPAGYRAALRAYIEQLDGMAIGGDAAAGDDAWGQGGAADTLSTVFIPGAVRVGNTDVDQYQVRLPSAVTQQMAQAAPMIGMLGLQGTTGYIAAADRHVIITTQPNPQLVNRAIETIVTGSGLGAATTEQLAEQRRLEQQQREREQQQQRQRAQPGQRRDQPGPPAWMMADEPEPEPDPREERRRQRERERQAEAAPDAPRTIADLRELALPESTVFEGYLSISGLVSTIELLMPVGVGGGGAELPPLALGLGVDGPNAAARLYVPHQNVRFVLDALRDMGMVADPEAEQMQRERMQRERRGETGRSGRGEMPEYLRDR